VICHGSDSDQPVIKSLFYPQRQMR